MIKSTNKGFTLIEILIVVVIVGIIMAIAIPNYSKYVKKSKRADGQAGLMAELHAQERQFSGSGTYTARTTTSEEGHYSITAAACSGSGLDVCVSLTAAPQGGHANDECGSLVINSKHEKSRTGTLPMDQCW